MLFDFKTFFLTLLEACKEYKDWLLVALALSGLLYFVYRCRLRNLPIKTSCNDLGELFVTRNAILRLIDNIGVEMKIGRVTRVRLKDKKHLLCVRMHVRLYRDQSFEQVSMQLQDKVQQTITKFLGVIKNVRVDIILDGIDRSDLQEKISE